MTNGEALRAKENKGVFGLASWLACRINCMNCPVDSMKCDQTEKSCSQKLLEWLEAEQEDGEQE